MTPEYLDQLADLADPDKLWRLSGIDQKKLTPGQRRQLDTGVALRRHASHIRRLNEALKKCETVLITPLSISGTYTRSRPTDDKRSLAEQQEWNKRHG